MSGTVLVTGAVGYIGSVLLPKLVERRRVIALDALWFEKTSRVVLDELSSSPELVFVHGDIRDTALIEDLFRRNPIDAVIHLAAVSNDPCSDIDPELTFEINNKATANLMRAAKRFGVRRFLNASSASVYGIKEEANVTEDLELEPLTLYARYKAETESVLNSLVDSDFCGVSVRAATVCGFSPRLRLDLTINILTSQALSLGEIRVFGGSQMRPNIHIDDLTDFYLSLLEADEGIINGQAFNVSTSNATVLELAEMVRSEIDETISITTIPTEDLRSYHLSAERARRELGFQPRHTLAQAVADLRDAFARGKVADVQDPIYRNVELMKRHPELAHFAGTSSPA